MALVVKIPALISHDLNIVVSRLKPLAGLLKQTMSDIRLPLLRKQCVMMQRPALKHRLSELPTPPPVPPPPHTNTV